MLCLGLSFSNLSKNQKFPMETLCTLGAPLEGGEFAPG